MTYFFTNRHIRGRLRFLSLVCIFLTCVVFAQAQISYSDVDGRTNSVNTAVPFLRIGPDARSGAMGDVGIALSPDANAAFWNLSKLPFSQNDVGFSATYTPWLRGMSKDVYLAYLSGYKKLNDREALAVSLRYFDMGSIQLTNFEGADLGSTHPREFSIDAGYARKLSENWSLGAALRFIHSNLANGIKTEAGTSYKSGIAVAGDLSVYYEASHSDSISKQGYWSFGATVTNIGSKISYTEGEDNKYYIPTNAGIGAAYTYFLNPKNKIALALDINKLLVPTPDSTDANHNGIPDYRQKSVVGSIFSSLGDAPGGMKEELHELMYSVGAEYWYDNMFAIRAGYYNEYKTKGNRKYLTVGFGLKYKMAGLDFSYLIPSGGEMQRNPLSNTLRISISYSK